MKKNIPKFDTEDEEREFWSTADSTEYIDWSKAERVVFPNLKPSLKKYPCGCPKACYQRSSCWLTSRMCLINR